MIEDGVIEKLSEKIKEISIAEFFEKNRHLLGYENPVKSLFTVVKEAVDNSLDACLEAKVLPKIWVELKEIYKNRIKVRIKDNGPGIHPSKLPIALGKFLVGSRFYRLRQSIGTQGIGIKGAILYAQLTTGKPVKVITSDGKEIHKFSLMIDVLKNEPIILSHQIKENSNGWHGLEIELEIEGRIVGGARSVHSYLKYISITNPFAQIIFKHPKGKEVFKRVVKSLPKIPSEIKPHPYGVELGRLKRMLRLTETKNLTSFLTSEFSRIGKTTAKKICKLARLKPNQNPKTLTHEEAERLHKAMNLVKISSPPLDCLSPIEEKFLLEGLKKEFNAEFYVTTTRKPNVYRGYPFQVQAALAYGGELPENCTLLRFANHTPLLYNQSDCVITKAVIETNWRNYGLSQPEKSFPRAPLVILVDFISVWIPYKSEGKHAIAEYPIILKEIKLALQEVGRRLKTFIKKKKKEKERLMRRMIYERYIPEIAKSLSILTKKEENEILEKLKEIIKV